MENEKTKYKISIWDKIPVIKTIRYMYKAQSILENIIMSSNMQTLQLVKILRHKEVTEHSMRIQSQWNIKTTQQIIDIIEALRKHDIKVKNLSISSSDILN